MATENYAYYIPTHRKVYGTDDPMRIAVLVGRFLKHLPADKEPGRYDGTSSYTVDGAPVERTIVHGKHVI